MTHQPLILMSEYARLRGPAANRGLAFLLVCTKFSLFGELLWTTRYNLTSGATGSVGSNNVSQSPYLSYSCFPWRCDIIHSQTDFLSTSPEMGNDSPQFLTLTLKTEKETDHHRSPLHIHTAHTVEPYPEYAHDILHVSRRW